MVTTFDWEDGPRSWYGEPQHEEGRGRGWEEAYYGEEHKGGPPSDTAFIPEIEYPAGFGVRDSRASETESRASDGVGNGRGRPVVLD